MRKIFAGEDKIIYLTISKDGDLINLGDFDNVICFIVDSKNKNIAQFSRETKEGFLEMNQQGDNVLIIDLKREMTKGLKRDSYKIEILTKKISSDFPEKFKSIGVSPLFQVVTPSTDAINL